MSSLHYSHCAVSRLCSSYIVHSEAFVLVSPQAYEDVTNLLSSLHMTRQVRFLFHPLTSMHDRAMVTFSEQFAQGPS